MIFFLEASVEEIGFTALFTLLGSFLGILGILAALLIMNIKRRDTTVKGSPYSKEPLLLGVDVARSLAALVEDFMLTQPQPENAPFDMSKAAVCRGTGRIFPDCVDKREVVRLGWDFLPKRHAGAYVSWGAISEEEQGRIKILQGTADLEDFQIQESSKQLLPTQVEDYYKTLSPGPLYVDRMQGILLGWKCVPGTHFEVLIVQLPKYKSIEETL